MKFERVQTRIKFDRWNRYLLPDPDTGEEKAFTRVSTIVNVTKDRYSIEQWTLRNTVFGMGQRPDLYAQAASTTLDDYGTLTSVVKQAQEAAASQAAANVGTALHRFLERRDKGEDVSIPSEFVDDVDAYYALLGEHEATVSPKWIERIVCIPKWGVVGQIDRILKADGWELPRIGDIKTATDKDDGDGGTTNSILKYGQTDMPIQLGMYAHAELYWNGKEWREIPKIDRRVGHIIHIPAGQGEARLYDVDLAAGWEAANLAFEVYQWRKRNDLIVQVAREIPAGSAETSGNGERVEPKSDDDPADESSSTPPATAPLSPQSEPPTPELREWLRERVNTIKLNPDSRKMLAIKWRQHPEIQTFKDGGSGPQTMAQFDLIASYCDEVEKEWSIPFPPSRPE